MSVSNNVPNFVATANIQPFDVVMLSGNLKVATATDNSGGYSQIGVCDGSVSEFNKTYHATAGEMVSLQNGRFVQLRAGNTTAYGPITYGTKLIVLNGAVIPTNIGGGNYIEFEACEAASTGEIFWAARVGAFYLPIV